MSGCPHGHSFYQHCPDSECQAKAGTKIRTASGTIYVVDCAHPPVDRNEFGVCRSCVAEGVGAKADQGKEDWTLLLSLTDALKEIVLVLMFGAKKYGRDNYVNVKDARNRYTAALLRHTTAWYGGEQLDSGPGGSDRHHLAAAGCCVLFLLAMDLRGLLSPVSERSDTTPKT